MDNSRLALLIGLVVLAMTGIVGALVGLLPRDGQPGVRPVVPMLAKTETPLRTEQSVMLAPAAAAGGQKARFTEPEFDVPSVSETPLIVDSFPPTRHMWLADWTSLDISAGYFDGFYRSGDRAVLDENATVDGDTIVLASGWSGDPQLGLPLRDIVLSQCGRIVARTRSVLDRPDVADAVHPNLRRSGWEAVILIADLAICADPNIRAWAVLPGRPAVLLPLKGIHRLATAAPSSNISHHVAALPPLLPKDVAPPAVTDIEIKVSQANLRRCGGLDCTRVGEIAGGRHRAHIADRRDGWSLLIFGDRSGWISDTLYRDAE